MKNTIAVVSVAKRTASAKRNVVDLAV